MNSSRPGSPQNVQGDEPFKDAGHVVWLPGDERDRPLSGPHRLCEAIVFGNFLTGLRAFCDALS